MKVPRVSPLLLIPLIFEGIRLVVDLWKGEAVEPPPKPPSDDGGVEK